MDSHHNRAGRAVARQSGRTRRELLRQATHEEILDIARRQIGTRGATALSLREIAQEMKITPPALYRYFASRGELIAALSVMAFRSFADTLEAARDSIPPEEPAHRFLAIGLAYRRWALAHPQDYALIFATPIPDFEMQAEANQVEAQRSLRVLFGALNDAVQTGKLKLPAAYNKPPAALQAMLNRCKKDYQLPYPTPIILCALVVWSRVHGLVSLELAGQLPGFLGAAVEEFYRTELAELGRQFGMDSEQIKRIK